MEEFVLRLSLIKKMRDKNNQQIADILGVSHSTARNYMTGETPIPMESIAKLCKDLNINIEWLVFGDGDPTAKPSPEASLVAEPSLPYGEASGRKKAVQMTEKSIEIIFNEIDALVIRVKSLENEVLKHHT